MRTAVYGLPFSGKTHFIDSLKAEDIDERTFSAYGKDGYTEPTDGSELADYDLVLYMDTDAGVIHGRMGDGTSLTAGQVSDWKETEVLSMKEKCFRNGTDFILLNGTDEMNLGFARAILSGKLKTPRMYAEAIVDDIMAHRDGRRVFITDCDGTLSYDDTTDMLMEHAGTDFDNSLFRNDRHTMFQAVVSLTAFEKAPDFMRWAQYAADNVRLSPLVDDLKQAEDIMSVGITAGSKDIWGRVAERIGFPERVYGKTFGSSDLYVSGDVKGWTARLLRERGVTVFASGDSPVDYRMLTEADRGYVAAFRKKNPRLGQYLEGGKVLSQPEYSPYPFETTRKVRNIHDDLD